MLPVLECWLFMRAVGQLTKLVDRCYVRLSQRVKEAGGLGFLVIAQGPQRTSFFITKKC